jgi:peptidyl-prolyl cis-trans isomerase SurA
MRLAKLVCGILLTATIYQSEAQQVMLDKVVAVVGGSSITYSEVQRSAQRLTEARRQQGYTSDRDPMNEALEQLMMQKLLYNQALIDSVEIMKAEILSRVEDEVQEMIAQEGTIPAVEAKMHNAIFNIRENLRRRYEEESYATNMQREVISKVTIIPGEVEQFYKQTDPDSLPIIGDQYVYAHITKFPKSIDEAKRRARERLLEMRERVITGEAKFDLLARIYSVDGSALHGGEMEPATLQTFVQPFADALSELKPGQISEVVETQYGFHLIQLIDKKGSLYHCRHILIRPTYTNDEMSEPDRQLDSIARLIKQDSISFADAALRFSDDPYSRQNGGIVTNHDLLEHYNATDARYTATKFLKEDFGSMGNSAIADFRVLSQLKEGEVSSAYQTQDMNGNQLSKIVKLVKIIPTHVASLNEDYLRLEQMALNDKQERVFEDWLTKKIDGMYVYIDPEFRDGDFLNKHWVK